MGKCFRNNFVAIALSMAAGTALSGCGNAFKTNVTKAPPETWNGRQSLLANEAFDPISGDTQQNTSEYACPSEPNVVPDYDWELDGSFFFRVCTSRKSDSDILIHGHTPNSRTICVFPAQYYDQTRIVWKPNVSTGQPEVQCVSNGPNGAYAGFPGMKYNAVFIVEMQDAAKMQLCLAGGNYYGCPKNYSFGVFR